MFHNLAIRAVFSAGALLSLLIACAGTKVNTPSVEGSFGKVGTGSVELAPESKHKEESIECRRCQRIADQIAENESTLDHPATTRKWKAMIRDELRSLKQQREHCLTPDCAKRVSSRE